MPLTFKELEKVLKDFGYVFDHQRGSHQTYSCGINMITIPKHKELKPGTAKSILEDIARQQSLDLKTLKSMYAIKL